MGIAYGEWKSFGYNVVNLFWISGPKVVDVFELHRLCFVELPEQRRLCPNFVKLNTPGYLWILLVLS